MYTAVFIQNVRRHNNVPNRLTLSRVVAGFLIPLWWYLGPEALFLSVVWAGVSDWLDGYLARKMGLVTTFGAMFDPLGDKLYTDMFLFGAAIAAVITTGSVELVFLWIVVAMYDADNTYQRRHDIARSFQGENFEQKKPVTWLSKSKTAVLFLLMGSVANLEWTEVLLFGLVVVDETFVEAVATFAIFMVFMAWMQSRGVFKGI